MFKKQFKKKKNKNIFLKKKYLKKKFKKKDSIQTHHIFSNFYSFHKTFFFINLLIIILIMCVINEEYLDTLEKYFEHQILNYYKQNKTHDNLFESNPTFLKNLIKFNLIKFLKLFVHFHKTGPDLYYLKIFCPVLIAELLVT